MQLFESDQAAALPVARPGRADRCRGSVRSRTRTLSPPRVESCSPASGAATTRSPRTTSRRTTRAGRGTEHDQLSTARAPGTRLPRGIVQRQQQPRELRGLSFVSAFAHDDHCSPRKSSLLREELRLSGTGKPLSTIFHDGPRKQVSGTRSYRRADRERRRVQPRRRPGPARAGLPVRRDRPRGPAAPLGRGVHPPSVGRREDLRRAAARRADDRRRAPARRRRGHRHGHQGGPRRVRRRDRAARRGRHEADADPVPEPRAGGGGELPQDDRRDGAGRARDPDQARRPPAQHAHDRVPGQAEAAAEGARRRSRSTRRSRTGSGSTSSSGSSRTSPSRRSIRASTRRSRRWSASAAPTARSTCARRR